ncbi:unnamed protein product [Prorocentrum cordatum]|uniref:Uncharacterized protein n=1 Tax=Prorocentrum cordatum TaxID=2364126 RepID=A0ABN9UFY4_9DINO|nr:unnamed protein product [Polarella glacialis]
MPKDAWQAAQAAEQAYGAATKSSQRTAAAVLRCRADRGEQITLHAQAETAYKASLATLHTEQQGILETAKPKGHSSNNLIIGNDIFETTEKKTFAQYRAEFEQAHPALETSVKKLQAFTDDIEAFNTERIA